MRIKKGKVERAVRKGLERLVTTDNLYQPISFSRPRMSHLETGAPGRGSCVFSARLLGLRHLASTRRAFPSLEDAALSPLAAGVPHDAHQQRQRLLPPLPMPPLPTPHPTHPCSPFLSSTSFARRRQSPHLSFSPHFVDSRSNQRGFEGEDLPHPAGTKTRTIIRMNITESKSYNMQGAIPRATK